MLISENNILRARLVVAKKHIASYESDEPWDQTQASASAFSPLSA